MPLFLQYIPAFIIAILCIVVVSLFFYLKFKKKYKNSDQEIVLLKKKYSDESDYLKREITRLNYIISVKQNSGANRIFDIVQNPTNSGEQTTDNSQVFELISGNEKLEDEKRKFQEKNKKLWEQSIAIHKEKERIDLLKRDIEARHKEVTDSINYAKRIQNALIPSNVQLQNCFNDYFVLWRPRDIVSGDFYWIKTYGETTVLVVADCTGHGVPGAFMSALGIALLNQIVSHNENLPANQILEELRILIKSSLKQTEANSDSKDGMDMALCILNRKTLKLSFAGANNSMYLVRNSELTELESTRNPIGIYLKEKQFIATEIDIQKNDVFYLFTDGYADEFGGEFGKKFKKEDFKKLIVELNKNNNTLAQQKAILENTMNQWLGEKYKQIDDILVFGFKI